MSIRRISGRRRPSSRKRSPLTIPIQVGRKSTSSRCNRRSDPPRRGARLTLQQLHLPYFSRRRLPDLGLFVFTASELIALIQLTTEFDAIDWIYVLANLLVLGIALTRRAPIV